MNILVVASLITAFIAGIAALFAPCCITVLLPSYLASIFREKYKVLLMTFVFFLGILTVFLPIGLGVSALAAFFREYHNAIFIGGGAFLMLLGMLVLMRKKMSLPFHINPELKQHNASSVFVLGIFSGIATTCCAPVLAGVLALSVLPGSVFWGGMYTLMYVLGMVAPLFFIALFLDKANFTKRVFDMRKPLEWNFRGRIVRMTIAEAISGSMFVIMGAVIVVLAFSGNLTVHSDYQTSLNIYLAQLAKTVNGALSKLPESLLVLIALTLIALPAALVIRSHNRKKIVIEKKYEQQ